MFDVASGIIPESISGTPAFVVIIGTGFVAAENQLKCPLDGGRFPEDSGWSLKTEYSWPHGKMGTLEFL